MAAWYQHSGVHTPDHRAMSLIEESPDTDTRSACQDPSGRGECLECSTHKRDDSERRKSSTPGKILASTGLLKGGSKNTMSQRSSRSAASLRNVWASIPNTRELSAPNSAKEARSALAARRSFSTKSTRAAPRERLSTPKAPDPAQRSRQLASTIESPSHANKVSRSLLGVGLRPPMAGKLSFRRFHLPPIMRTCPVRAAMPSTRDQSPNLYVALVCASTSDKGFSWVTAQAWNPGQGAPNEQTRSVA